jgi:RimJ/RimL family protein N-acetyltransferase
MTLPAPLLRGERLRLTALNADDVATIVCWDEDAHLQWLYDARPARPRSPAEITQWLNDLRGDDHTI